MSQDDSPPPDRSSGPRFSRDTLLLLGALAFLILAVALTFLFTPNTGDQTGQVRPTTDGQLTPVGGTPGATPGGEAYPSPEVTAGTDNPYPGQSAVDATPGATSPSEPSITPPLESTTETVAAFDSPTPEDNPYPLPDGTPPAQPTFNPAVFTATTQPPPPPVPTQGAAGGQQPTAFQQPTDPPAPTDPPLPTAVPLPTSPPAPTREPEPTATAAPPPPAAPPVDVLRGNVRWSAGQSPIILRRDVQLAPGAELIIEPGVEVRVDPGVSIYVDGARMLALGLPGQQVRFVGSTGARWSGIFGRPGSFIVMENTEVRGAGAGGTMMAVDSSELVVRSSRFIDNGGGILLTDTKLEMKDSEMAGNDVPFGAAIDASYARGTSVTFQRNRFGGNRLSEGAPMVRFANQSAFSGLILDVSGNLIRGGTPNLQLSTNGPLEGSVACNALVGDGLGLGLRTQTIQVAPNGVPPLGLSVVNNFLDEHIPPIIPVYLRYGLGRGATSEVLIDMRNNWWGEPTGPYEPDANADGRGDSVGSNILFAPWLTEPPPCAPSR